MQVLQPAGWPKPKGFANGIAAEGRVVFVAGQVAFDAGGKIVGGNFVDQARQALGNIVAVLKEGGAGPEHLTRMTWFVTNVQEYLDCLRDLGAAYREAIGEHYPAMTLVGVTGLMIPGAKLEIEATAVVPPA